MKLRKLKRKQQKGLHGRKQDAASLSRLFERAMQHHQAGQFREAESCYRQLIKLSPASADPHNNLGVLYHGQGRIAEAASCYERALKLKPDHADALNNLGVIRKLQGRLEEAAACHRRALAVNRNDIAAHNNLGTVLKSQGRLAEAAESFRQVLALDPLDIDALSNLGNVLIDQGKAEEAIACYEKVLDQRPDHRETHINSGLALLQLGRQDEAASSFQRALAGDPLNPDVPIAIGNALLSRNMAGEALTWYQKALQAAPNSEDALLNHGNALLVLNRADEAIACFEKILDRNPDNPAAHAGMGDALRGLNKVDEALACYEKALALKPDFFIVLNNMGNGLQSQGKLTEAVACFEKALALAPNSFETYNNLGNALQFLNKIDASTAAYQKALQINPGYAKALENLADIYEKTSRIPEAKATVERGLQDDPDNAFLRVVLAKCLRREGAADRAVELLEQAAAQSLPPALEREVNFELGRLYDRAGDSERAFQCFAAGNAIARSSAALDPAQYLHRIDVLSGFFSEDLDLPAPAPAIETGEKAPVFLIGFPRSGTTLLDQILDSHPAIQTIEEREMIGQVQKKIAATPEELIEKWGKLTDEEIRQLRDLYFEVADKYISRDPGCILIDKFPLNIIRVPLIWRIFPAARFILALRHPYDVCLSCFMQDFKVNDAMANFFTLEDAATLYAKVMKLWQQYITVLPIRFHAIKYEELVADFESATRGLLGFLGVPWDNGITRYNEHARQRGRINTPSYHQVTEPIYQRAKYRWKRYAGQIEPVSDTLQPYIDYFGYDG